MRTGTGATPGTTSSASTCGRDHSRGQRLRRRRRDYDDPYTGVWIDYWQGNGALIDIDHVVSLGNAWATGAFSWEIKKRAAFANDPLNLLPADAGANRQKGDGDAATWLPANKPFRCAYVSRQVAVKAKYDLAVTAPEKTAIERVLTTCLGEALPHDTWGASTVVDHNITDPADATNDAATDSSAVPPTYDRCNWTRRVQPVRPRSASGIRGTAHTWTGTGTAPLANDARQFTMVAFSKDRLGTADCARPERIGRTSRHGN